MIISVRVTEIKDAVIDRWKIKILNVYNKQGDRLNVRRS